MRLRFSKILGTALICSCGGVFAQSGDLAGVTMRVLDDVSDVDKVILALDARGAGDEGADEAKAAEAAARRAAEASAEADPLNEGRDRAQLHDPDDDERSEGKLEDRDVEQPTSPAVP